MSAHPMNSFRNKFHLLSYVSNFCNPTKLRMMPIHDAMLEQCKHPGVQLSIDHGIVDSVPSPATR